MRFCEKKIRFASEFTAKAEQQISVESLNVQLSAYYAVISREKKSPGGSGLAIVLTLNEKLHGNEHDV